MFNNRSANENGVSLADQMKFVLDKIIRFFANDQTENAKFRKCIPPSIFQHIERQWLILIASNS